MLHHISRTVRILLEELELRHAIPALTVSLLKSKIREKEKLHPLTRKNILIYFTQPGIPKPYKKLIFKLLSNIPE